jgi:hypothetical protein
MWFMFGEVAVGGAGSRRRNNAATGLAVGSIR